MRSLRSCFQRLQLNPWSSRLYSSTFLVDARNAPANFDPTSAVVYEDFLAAAEGEALIRDISSRMHRYVQKLRRLVRLTLALCGTADQVLLRSFLRRRYEQGHWDAVITDYKEVELGDESTLSTLSQQTLDKCREELRNRHLKPSAQFLPCHAIALRGQLKAHVDSIRFSGSMVAGISLLSSSIMRLVPANNNGNKHWIDLCLPPLSLYVLTGMSRYDYTHELLEGTATFQHANTASVIHVQRDQRLSIIFRDMKGELE